MLFSRESDALKGMSDPIRRPTLFETPGDNNNRRKGSQRPPVRYANQPGDKTSQPSVAPESRSTATGMGHGGGQRPPSRRSDRGGSGHHHQRSTSGGRSSSPHTSHSAMTAGDTREGRPITRAATPQQAILASLAYKDRDARTKAVAGILLHRVHAVGRPIRRHPVKDARREYVRSGLSTMLTVEC